MRVKIAQPEQKDQVVARTPAPPQSMAPAQAIAPQSEAATLLHWQRTLGNHVVQRRLKESMGGGLLRAPIQLWQSGAPALLSERLIQEQEASERGMTGEKRQPENKTGLPDDLKAGIENLSGLAMDDVRVHYNSSKPAQLQALAYTQGTDIFVGPGQERHLPHEAWHVVQQKEGRVRPTSARTGGALVNDEGALEREADVMGWRAFGAEREEHISSSDPRFSTPMRATVIQRLTMSMPGSLNPPVLTAPKQKWHLSAYFTGDDQNKLKQHLTALIPADATPSPEERVRALTYIEVSSYNLIKKMPLNYETAAAKAETNGEVYLNKDLDDYYNTDGTPNADKIKTTAVHEALHAVSANCTGLQNYANLISEGAMSYHQPDEAVTDYLAAQVYEQLYGKRAIYNTGYWVPADQNVAYSGNTAKTDLAKAGTLPAMWTGNMVSILLSILGVDEEKLKGIYFKDPGQFQTLINNKQEEIKNQWYSMIYKETLEQHVVLTTKYKLPLLDEVIKGKMADLENKSDLDQIAIVRVGLEERGVLDQASHKKIYTDALIKTKIQRYIPLKFEVRYATKLGEELYVTGDKPELGNWKPAAAPKLGYQDAQTWRGVVTLDEDKASQPIEYKYLVKQGTQVIRWEEGGNHRPGQLPNKGNRVHYSDYWDDGR